MLKVREGEMKTFHITHNDLDGVGCAVLTKMFSSLFPQSLLGEVEVYMVNNSKHSILNAFDILRKDQDQYDNIIVSDVCLDNYPFCTQVLESLSNSGKKVKYLDHHQSIIKPDEIFYVDESKCGCYLLYEFLFDSVVTNPNNFKAEERKQASEAMRSLIDLIKIIDDYDRWNQQYPFSRNFNRYYYAVGENLFIEKCIDYVNRKLSLEEDQCNYPEDFYYDFFNEFDLMLLRKLESEVLNASAKAYEDMTVANISDKKVAFIIDPKYGSEIADYILSKSREENNAIDIVVFVNLNKETFSLRSYNKDETQIDVAAIAKKNGGGGHPNASGFSCQGIREEIVAILMDKIIF